MTLGWICCSVLAITQVVSAQSKSEINISANPRPPLQGFSSKSSSGESDWEKRFRDGIVPDNIRENMRRLSAHVLANVIGIPSRNLFSQSLSPDELFELKPCKGGLGFAEMFISDLD